MNGIDVVLLLAAVGIVGAAVWWIAKKKRPTARDDGPTPIGMDVQVDVLDAGKPIASDTLCMRAESAETVLVAEDGRRYVFRHTFGLPTSTIEIEASDFRSGLAMGSHDSDDWERIALWQKQSLRFKCKLRYEPPLDS
jgi:hypothetical protein